MLAYRVSLGLPVASPCTCAGAAKLEPLGDLALSCGQGVGRIARHNLLNKMIRDAMSEAGCVAILEPRGLNSGNRQRPDGLTALGFVDGLPLTWDTTMGSAPYRIGGAMAPPNFRENQ